MVGEYEGRVFDDRTETFTLGETLDDEVIYGIQTALSHFGKGEKSKLTIMPEFAFGAKGSDKFGIPPMASVVYTVTLNDFERVRKSMDLTIILFGLKSMEIHAFSLMRHFNQFYRQFQEPQSWKLDEEQSLEQAKLVKDKATQFLKNGKYQMAVKLYEKANTYLSNCTSSKSKLITALIIPHISMLVAFLKLK